MHVLRRGIRNNYIEKITFNIKPEADSTRSIFQKHCLKKKKKTTGLNGVICAKSHVTKLRPNLTAVGASQECNLSRSVWDFLISTSEVIHLVSPLLLPT